MTNKHLAQNAETVAIRLSAESSAFIAGLLADAKPIPAMRKAKQLHDVLISNG